MATEQSSSVRRSEVGSAQCRSSNTSTVGPWATSLAKTVRMASKVARCNCSGVSFLRAVVDLPGPIPITIESSPARSSPASVPKTAFSPLSSPALTTSSLSSGAMPAQAESNCW